MNLDQTKAEMSRHPGTTWFPQQASNRVAFLTGANRFLSEGNSLLLAVAAKNPHPVSDANRESQEKIG
jgi:hypothetical protein